MVRSCKGYQSLISQLKHRKHAVLNVARNVDNKFAVKYANSILISKLNYHIQLWGACSRTDASKINRLLIETAIKITNCIPGRTDEYILKSIKWTNFNVMYENSIIKFTHKLLNHDKNNKHFLFNIITDGRTIRNINDNKCGPRIMILRNDNLTLKTYS